ncbi:helix-turn-helix domain-containing protein [Ensifer adhaerens]|uniref:helix-turn-helix domain-containing protein n=1 Tax=Ensifer adhaerens TaxID=106592 RepID=UPI003D0064E9
MTETSQTVVRALRQRLDKIELQNRILESERDLARAAVESLKLDMSAQQATILEQAARLSDLDVGSVKEPVVSPLVPTREIIIDVLKDFPGITLSDVLGTGRGRALVAARHACMHAVHIRRPDLSYPTLGRIFGGRDHTSVLHAVRKIEKEQT